MIQQRLYRKRRRRSFSLAFLLLVIRFWDTPVLQRFWRRLLLSVHFDTTSDSFEALQSRGIDLLTVLRKKLERFMEELTSNLTRVKTSMPSFQSNCSANCGTKSKNASLWRRNETEAGGINANIGQIQSILIFWFGQYSPDTAQKKLWMIAASSVEHRKSVDAEIVEKFEQVVLDLCQNGGVLSEEWSRSEIYGYSGKVAVIVALDQFSRHIRRHYECNTSQCPLVPQNRTDAFAHGVAEAFIRDHWKEIECGMIPLPMHIFSLMPFRHAHSLAASRLVQEHIEQCAGTQLQMQAMLGRFRKATNRRMALLQDEGRRMGKAQIEDSDSREATVDSASYSSQEGAESKEFKDEDILETFPFEADMTQAADHTAHRTISSFLASRNINPANGNLAPVIVSLSGGVDSMVIASVLSNLAKRCDYQLNVVGIHINYANRPESEAEAEYVKQYCRRLSISFKCRVIDEVTRGVTPRDEYERIAREARYDIYRDTVRECRSRAPNQPVGVMLGHHRGDLRENVLSNAHKGCGPLDLSGMTAVSKNDGVLIYRPLLPLEKKDIYDYAHKFGVPYFKDTTPHWSTRGKLRNKLLPLLQEIYGEGSMSNLSDLAIESDEARDLLQESMFGPFLDQVHHSPMGILFDTTPWKAQGLFFWKFVLREALHGAALGMFSDKSVVSFLKRVQEATVRAGWLQCRRDYAVYLDANGKIFVLYPDSFPFRKADQFACVGQEVKFGRQHAIRVGPWKIMVEAVPEDEEQAKSAETHLAVPSMESFMDGFIWYCVQVPDTAQALVFCSGFNKRSRPRSWKNTDLKIQSTLPLLGNNPDALNFEGKWMLAKVTLTRDGAKVGLKSNENGNRQSTSREEELSTSFCSESSNQDRALELCKDLDQVFQGSPLK